MAQKIKILRAAAANSPPPTLEQGEIAVNGLADPAELWTGVPTSRHPSGRINLLEGMELGEALDDLTGASGTTAGWFNRNATGQWMLDTSGPFLPINNPAFTGFMSGEPWAVMGLTPNGTGGGRHYIATAAAGAAIDWNYGTLNFWVDSGMTVGAATWNAPVRVRRQGLAVYGNVDVVVTTGGINNQSTTALQAPAGGPNLVIRNAGGEVPGPVGGDLLPLQTGWPTIKLRTDASWDGGGLNTNERVYSNAILEMGQSGWSFAGLYRANDPVDGQLGGRSNQLRIRNNEFPTVGLVLDAITRTISISDSSLMLGANATQPLEAVPLQQLNAAIAGAGVTISATAPSTPAIGKLWFDSSSLQLFIYFNDGTNSQWVPVISQPR